jgi:hypothetical protein
MGLGGVGGQTAGLGEDDPDDSDAFDGLADRISQLEMTVNAQPRFPRVLRALMCSQAQAALSAGSRARETHDEERPAQPDCSPTCPRLALYLRHGESSCGYSHHARIPPFAL